MKLSTKQLLSVFGAFLLGLVVAATTFADDQLYVISANAGGVSEVSGKVTIIRDGKSKDLTTKDEIKSGEIVTTANDAKAEILLSPGSYLRLGGNSEFQFEETAVDRISLKLIRGSAIFEVISIDNIGLIVNTPKNRINLQFSGVYRIDLTDNGASAVSVFRGKVWLNGKTAVRLKSKQRATLENGEISVSKFNTKVSDELSSFSQIRAQEIVELNRKLSYRDLRSAFGIFDASRSSSLSSGIYGYWILDRRTGRYCFVPFSPFDSPYGYRFGSNMYDCVPNWGWNGMPMGGSNGSNNGNNNGNGNGGNGNGGPVKPSDATQPANEKGLPKIREPRETDTNPTGSKEESPRYNPPPKNDPPAPRNDPPAPRNDPPVYTPPAPRNDPPPRDESPRTESPRTESPKVDPPVVRF